MINRDDSIATLDQTLEPLVRLNAAMLAGQRASLPDDPAANAVILCPAQARAASERKPHTVE